MQYAFACIHLQFARLFSANGVDLSICIALCIQLNYAFLDTVNVSKTMHQKNRLQASKMPWRCRFVHSNQFTELMGMIETQCSDCIRNVLTDKNQMPLVQFSSPIWMQYTLQRVSKSSKISRSQPKGVQFDNIGFKGYECSVNVPSHLGHDTTTIGFSCIQYPLLLLWMQI